MYSFPLILNIKSYWIDFSFENLVIVHQSVQNTVVLGFFIYSVNFLLNCQRVYFELKSLIAIQSSIYFQLWQFMSFENEATVHEKPWSFGYQLCQNSNIVNNHILKSNNWIQKIGHYTITLVFVWKTML